MQHLKNFAVSRSDGKICPSTNEISPAKNYICNSAFLRETIFIRPTTWCFSELEPSCREDDTAQSTASLEYYMSKK